MRFLAEDTGHPTKVGIDKLSLITHLTMKDPNEGFYWTITGVVENGVLLYHRGPKTGIVTIRKITIMR